MNPHNTIDSTLLPLTVDALAEQFAACGLAAGQIVLVHSAMSKLGWVAGGAVAVIQALLRVLGSEGTLMMPTHTANNTDPAHWQNPPVPTAWWQLIRDHMPAFDPAITPTYFMGAIPETFRSFPGVRRSSHPVASFAAWGKHAADLTADHPLVPMFGDDSPVDRLYQLDGQVLLLGVTHENNTSLHLAEERAVFPRSFLDEGTAMWVDGQRKWVTFQMPRLDTDDFDSIGAAYEASKGITRQKVGRAEARLIRQRPLVDFAVQWMNAHRSSVNGQGNDS
jgi:aminoglycoside 3-N-acetyltransferase